MLFMQARLGAKRVAACTGAPCLNFEQLESRLNPSVNFVDSGQELVPDVNDDHPYLSADAELADVDGDGDLDALVLSHRSYGVVDLWLNDGIGRFRDSGVRIGGGFYVWDFSIDDLDGDGDLDVLLEFPGGGGGKYPEGYPCVWLNDGSGGFSSTGQLFQHLRHWAVGDIDNDGDVDAVTLLTVPRTNIRSGFSTWYNDGTAHFTMSDDSFGSGSRYANLELGDLDGDGDLDAILISSIWGPAEVWFNDGQGLFVDSGNRIDPQEGDNIWKTTLGDLDGDGDLDVFLAIGIDAENKVWLNDGNGKFMSSGQRLYEAHAQSVELGDLDGDGDLDVFSANYNWPDNVWENDGNGVFIDTGQRLGGERDSHSVALGDLDDDGDLDAFVAQYRSPDKVWINQTETSSVLPEYLPGDADRDFRFNVRDILRVSQVGKYSTGVPANWSEGDWNGDGIFDQLDLVAALQTGTYSDRYLPIWREPNYPFNS